MKVQTQRINDGPMVVIGEPLEKDIGIVVDLDVGKAFPKWHFNSIMLRGYWGKVTATVEQQEEAIKLAMVRVGEPLRESRRE